MFADPIRQTLDYLNDPIPITWLDTCDRLKEICEDEPLLRVSSSDPAETTVVSVMREKGALDGCLGNSAIEKTRAMVMLQFFAQLGVVVYYDNVPGMTNHVVLGPQWILDNITYVVRDYQRHRLRRDRNARKLDGGGAWKDLLERGIVSNELLERLWVGETRNHGFLVRLMRKLDLFAPLQGGKFLVPCTVTSIEVADGCHLEPPNVSEHLGTGVIRECKFVFDKFLPNGLFERVLTVLVRDWPAGYSTENPPMILTNHAKLYLSADELQSNALSLVLDVDKCTITAFAAEECAKIIFGEVLYAVRGVIKSVYSGRVKFANERVSEWEDNASSKTRNAQEHHPHDTCTPQPGTREADQVESKMDEQTEQNRQDLVKFFEGAKLPLKLAIQTMIMECPQAIVKAVRFKFW